MPIEIQRTAIVRGAVEMAISDAAAREDATEWLEFSLRVEPYPRDSQSVAMVRLAALYRALLVVHDEMERLAEPLRPSADNRPPEERTPSAANRGNKASCWKGPLGAAHQLATAGSVRVVRVLSLSSPYPDGERCRCRLRPSVRSGSSGSLCIPRIPPPTKIARDHDNPDDPDGCSPYQQEIPSGSLRPP